jgi:hypothetical protein
LLVRLSDRFIVLAVFVLVTAGVLLVFSSRGILSCIFVVVHRSYAL